MNIQKKKMKLDLDQFKILGKQNSEWTEEKIERKLQKPLWVKIKN